MIVYLLNQCLAIGVHDVTVQEFCGEEKHMPHMYWVVVLCTAVYRCLTAGLHNMAMQ